MPSGSIDNVTHPSTALRILHLTILIRPAGMTSFRVHTYGGPIRAARVASILCILVIDYGIDYYLSGGATLGYRHDIKVIAAGSESREPRWLSVAVDYRYRFVGSVILR